MGRIATESCGHQVRLRGAGDGRELVHHHRNRRRRGGAHGNLHLGVRFDGRLPALVFRLTSSGAAAAVGAKHLGLDVFQRLVDSGNHVCRLGQADQMSAPPFHRDFRDVAVLFDCKNHFALDVVTQNFGEFAEAGFDLVTNGGSYFILPAKILYCH